MSDPDYTYANADGERTPFPAYDEDANKLITGTARDKLRDEFFSFDTDKNWDVLATGAGHAVGVDGVINGARYLKISPGTAINSETVILSKQSFRLPVKLAVGVSLSQRIVNQEFYVELVGVDADGNVETDSTFPAPTCNDATNCASFAFQATSATQAIYAVRSAGCSPVVSAASTFGTTAATGTTPNFIPATIFELNADMERAVFTSSAVDSAAAPTAQFQRTLGIPEPGRRYKIRIRAKNLGTAPASATDFRIHFIRLLDSTRFTVDFSRHAGRRTDIANSLPVIITDVVPTLNVAVNAPTVAATGGGTLINHLSLASTNALLVKASAGRVYSINASNVSASPRFLKVYGKATAPVPGTDTPALIIALPPNSHININPSCGFQSLLGIGIAITGAAAPLDATAIGANEVTVQVVFA